MKEKDRLMLEHRREILLFNYWEHVKYEKDLSFVRRADHPQRLEMRELANEMLDEIHKLDALLK